MTESAAAEPPVPATDKDATPAAKPAIPDRESIPLSRFNEVNNQKKELTAALEEIAETLTDQLPEHFRALVPSDLPAVKRIKWLQSASASGLFTEKPAASPDAKRPSGKPPENLDNMSSQTLMSRGYKK